MSRKREKMDKYKRNDVRKEAVERLARRFKRIDIAENAASTLQRITNELRKKEVIKEVDIYKALADESRLLILKLLMDGELCGCEIMTALNKPQPSTSYHISILKKAGLIKERREGRWSYYRLSDGAVIEVMKQIKLFS